jgi:hypothetical protein
VWPRQDPSEVPARAIISEGTAMSSYPYPPGPGTGSGAGTGLSDDALSVTEPGADSAYATSGSTAAGPTTSSTDVAKDEAAGVRDTATQAGRQVAGTAKEQAGEVVSEAREQARTLLDRTRTEVSGQASTQQQRAAESLRSLSGELRSMASAQQEPGMATDLAQQAADKAGQLASWLADREPGDVLDEVSAFARRRPGMFLALAAGAGVIAGRLTRGIAAGAPSHQSSSGWSTSTSGRHMAGMAGTTDLTGTGDADTTGTRPFTRATGGGMAGYPSSDPLVTGTSSTPGADLTPPTPTPGLGTTGVGAADTDAASGAPGNDVTR